MEQLTSCYTPQTSALDKFACALLAIVSVVSEHKRT